MSDLLLQDLQWLSHLGQAIELREGRLPLSSLAPVPIFYKPISFSRHIWSSLQGIYEFYHSAAYTNQTAKHVFSATNQYVALLTPLAVLSWNKDKAEFEDNFTPDSNSKVHVGLFLGDSADGAYHEDIYRMLEIRRAYVESVLREQPSIGDGLLRFCQSGKPLAISRTNPEEQLDPIYKGSVYQNFTTWKHIAAEDYFFDKATSAVNVMKNLPWLNKLVWDGSSGSFGFASQIRLEFDFVGVLQSHVT